MAPEAEGGDSGLATDIPVRHDTLSTAPLISDSPGDFCADGVPAIDAQGLSKVFGSRKALDKLSFTLPHGAFLSIFGPNGAGKSTLLRIISTLARPSLGTARILGFDLKEQPDRIREHIGFVSHRSLLYPDLTAEENLTFAARLYGVADPTERIARMLATVELAARRHDPVRSFSRGMTQRLAIARALIHDPRLVFLDEPYSGLDPHAAEILDGLLGSVRDGRSFVMVSHDLHKGFDLSTHVLMLAKGRSVLFAPRDEIAFDNFARQYRDVVGRGVA